MPACLTLAPPPPVRSPLYFAPAMLLATSLALAFDVTWLSSHFPDVAGELSAGALGPAWGALAARDRIATVALCLTLPLELALWLTSLRIL